MRQGTPQRGPNGIGEGPGRLPEGLRRAREGVQGGAPNIFQLLEKTKGPFPASERTLSSSFGVELKAQDSPRGVTQDSLNLRKRRTRGDPQVESTGAPLEWKGRKLPMESISMAIESDMQGGCFIAGIGFAVGRDFLVQEISDCSRMLCSLQDLFYVRGSVLLRQYWRFCGTTGGSIAGMECLLQKWCVYCRSGVPIAGLVFLLREWWFCGVNMAQIVCAGGGVALLEDWLFYFRSGYFLRNCEAVQKWWVCCRIGFVQDYGVHCRDGGFEAEPVLSLQELCRNGRFTAGVVCILQEWCFYCRIGAVIAGMLVLWCEYCMNRMRCRTGRIIQDWLYYFRNWYFS